MWFGISPPEWTASYYIATPKYTSSSWDGYDPDTEYLLCTNENSTQSAIDAPYGADIAVSCCSDDGSAGYRPNCTAYAKTYAEAATLCCDNGYRLCTLQELLWQKLTASQGCEFDFRYNWVSDGCSGWVLVIIFPIYIALVVIDYLQWRFVAFVLLQQQSPLRDRLLNVRRRRYRRLNLHHQPEVFSFKISIYVSQMSLCCLHTDLVLEKSWSE